MEEPTQSSERICCDRGIEFKSCLGLPTPLLSLRTNNRTVLSGWTVSGQQQSCTYTRHTTTTLSLAPYDLPPHVRNI